MLWYYVSEGQERLAVPDDQLAALAGSGILRPTTLLWRKGMKSWISAGEVKPELFSGPAGSAPLTASAADASPPASLEETGLITELSRSLRPYACWVGISGWLHGLAGVACVAGGTVLGYFAVRNPARLTDWALPLPAPLRLVAEYPWWAVSVLALMALLLFLTAAQLLGGAAFVRRAETSRSRNDLRLALRSVGGFFRTTVLTLFLGLLLLSTGVLVHYRPWKKEEPAPPAVPSPPPAPKPARERVTI